MPSRVARSRRLLEVPLLEVFEPAKYNTAELDFFLHHLGENPRALVVNGLPRGVNAHAVDEVLGSVYEYDQIQKASPSQRWCGPAPIKESIEAYQRWQEVSRVTREHIGVACPSMYGWDQDGHGVKGAVGSDSGFVRSIIQEGGTRQSLRVQLNRPPLKAALDDAVYRPSFLEAKSQVTTLTEDFEKGHLECPICHFVRSYEVGDPKSRYQALIAMRSHLSSIRKDRSAHRALRTHVFPSNQTESVPIFSALSEVPSVPEEGPQEAPAG